MGQALTLQMHRERTPSQPLSCVKSQANVENECNMDNMGLRSENEGNLRGIFTTHGFQT